MVSSLVGIAVAFAVILYLVAKGADLVWALVLGIATAGLFLPLTLHQFAGAILAEIINPVTIQLIAAVCLISGLGQLMKDTGDLDLIVSSLVCLLRSDKLLCMLIPALFGILTVPGGALMSAPLVEESAKGLKLSRARLSAVNLFFRHIGYFAYPLYPSLIFMSQSMGVDRLLIIKYNLLPMLAGLITAYRLYFGRAKGAPPRQRADVQTGSPLRDLLLGLSPILIMLTAVLLFNLPFYLAVMMGVLTASARGCSAPGCLRMWCARLTRFVTEWVDYKVGLAIAAIMGFKGIIAASGAVDTALAAIVHNGIPLPLLTATAALAVSYAIGVHLAATGLLVPIFILLFPASALGPMVSLLFSCIVIGYLLSPLHLCLTFSNQYFNAGLFDVYKQLFWPLLAILATALLFAFAL